MLNILDKLFVQSNCGKVAFFKATSFYTFLSFCLSPSSSLLAVQCFPDTAVNQSRKTRAAARKKETATTREKKVYTSKIER